MKTMSLLNGETTHRKNDKQNSKKKKKLNEKPDESRICIELIYTCCII